MKGFENTRNLLEEYLKETKLRHDSFSFETSYIKFGCNFTTISWVKISELLMDPLECKNWFIYKEQPKLKKVKLYAFVWNGSHGSADGADLKWQREGIVRNQCWKRCPSEDKEVKIEE